MTLSSILDRLTVKSLLLACAAFSAALLGGALVGQYMFDLHPCDLCILQRYPYLAILVISVPAALWMQSRTQKIMLLVCVVLLFTDAGVAFYHTGVEQGWFKGPDACSAGSSSGEMTLEEMRRAIMNAPLVSCSQAMGYVLGLSLAAWNAMLATAMGLFVLAMLRRRRG
jgi:disulfide bond formation protein DsbB